MHVLVKANLKTREQEIVMEPRHVPYTKIADSLNFDHYRLVMKHRLGKIIDGRFIPEKKWLWFDKEVPA